MLIKRSAQLLKFIYKQQITAASFLHRQYQTFSTNQSNDQKTPKGFQSFERKHKKSPASNPQTKEETKSSTKQSNINVKQDQNQSTSEPKKQEQKQTINQKNEEQKNNAEQNEQNSKEQEYKKRVSQLNQFFDQIFSKKNEKVENNKQKNGQKQRSNNSESNQGQSNKAGSTFSSGQLFNFKNMILLMGGGVIATLLYDYYQSKDQIDYKYFLNNLMQGDRIKKIYIIREQDGNHYKIYAKIIDKSDQNFYLNLGNVDHFLENLETLQKQQGKELKDIIPVEFYYPIDKTKIFDRAVNLVYLVATVGITYYLFKSVRATMNIGGRGGDIFGVAKSNAKIVGIQNKVDVKFKDVAGLDEAKNEIIEFVDFLKKPEKYKLIGAKLPKGALLSGPPGTGKTLLAKACAGEASVPFLFISGSDFVEMFVGVGAARVRDLFKQAKDRAPSIIFIDEIDAVGRKRESKLGGNDERDNTLNQLLVEMDGFGTDSNVIVMAATNRKELLDPALTRPGRFDRTIDITLPDIDGRKQIFMVHLQPITLDKSKTKEDYAKRLSTLTPGFSGADIANLVNEAAILAARQNKKCVQSIDFEMATERIIAGLEKKKFLTQEEKKIIATHESGHAVVSWFLEGGSPLLKVTIIPRSKGALGFAQYLPNESSLVTKDELIDRICTILGGRCAEQIFFQSVTTGAYDDLKKAYELCHQIVTKFGMSDVIGNVGYQESEYSKSYSDQTNKLIDDEIKKLIDEATERTKNLIEQYRPQIESLASALMEKETLDLKQIKQILGERPFPPKSTFKAYLETQQEIDKEENEKEERLKKEAQQKKQTQQNQGNQDNQNNQQKKEQSN